MGGVLLDILLIFFQYIRVIIKVRHPQEHFQYANTYMTGDHGSIPGMLWSGDSLISSEVCGSSPQGA